MVARVMILAGGTGGHVFPALAVANDLRQRGNEVYWMGTEKGLEAKIVPQYGYLIDWLTVSGFRGKSGIRKLLTPFQLIRSCWQAGRVLLSRKPDVVLGMGGFVSGPGGFIAWLLRIPLIVHEQNRIPGTTNRLLVPFARKVLEAFPESFRESIGAVCTGNPLRSEITLMKLDKKTRRKTHPRILIIGGSQGAQVLNEIVPGALARLSVELEVLHQTGKSMQVSTEEDYKRLAIDARVDAFIENMAQTYAWADLAICRSGAMTISELAAVGLPAILVPFPHAIDDHQTHNGAFLVDAGAALMIPQAEFNEARLAAVLSELLSDWHRLEAMSDAARMKAKPDAAHVVADFCLQVAAQ